MMTARSAREAHPMYRVVMVTGTTREIVLSDRRGAPLTKEEADRAAVRFTATETDRTVSYEVEPF